MAGNGTIFASNWCEITFTGNCLLGSLFVAPAMSDGSGKLLDI